MDYQSNGIVGGAVLNAELFSRSGNSGTLLESIQFDAANPGTLIGGNRFKPLAVPLTLLPGPYTFAAFGFDPTNPPGDSGLMQNANESIQFLHTRHGNVTRGLFPRGPDSGMSTRRSAAA